MKNEKDGYYHFGGPTGDEIGWIKKEFVTSWNTRFCLDPALPQPDRHFTVFEDPEGKDAAVKFTGEAGRVPEGNRRFAMITDASVDGEETPPQRVVVFTGLVDSEQVRQRTRGSLQSGLSCFRNRYNREHGTLIEVARQVIDSTARH